MGLLKGNTWSDYVQSHLVPAQYFRSVNESTGEPTEEYLEFSNFLADINNERAVKNKTYAENLASGLVFEKTKGAHMELSDELLEGVFKKYFAPEKASWKSDGEKKSQNQEVMEL